MKLISTFQPEMGRFEGVTMGERVPRCPVIPGKK